MARNLRIAVSVFFALLIVALCVMWVRSYWFWDRFEYSFPVARFIASTLRGTFVLVTDFQGITPNSQNGITTVELTPFRTVKSGGRVLGGPVPQIWRNGKSVSAAVPYWLTCLILTAAICVLNQSVIRQVRLPTNFSLRTLLIATTLVAVALGLGVWLAS